jgi:hypothetical protein
MARHRLAFAIGFIAIVPLSLAAVSVAAIADNVPESLRIEQKAKKAYSEKPVVPIERGNAHHRDIGGDGDSAPSVPDAIKSVPAQPNPKDKPAP